MRAYNTGFNPKFFEFFDTNSFTWEMFVKV